MAHSLQEFLNQANANTIRATNLFEIMCTSGYDDIDQVMQKVTLYGQNFNIPTRTINYASVSYKGFAMENIVPTSLAMENTHTVTVLADVNGELRRAFLAWQGKVMDPNISDGSVFAGDRGINEKSTIRLQLFDKDNETVIETYKFFNVRVTNVGGISLTYDGGDKATFDVEFKSTYWEIEKADKGAFTSQR